ncbi:hypothetical protein ACFY3N_28135 [Streptomyces sp. NPDC000348]
MAARTRPKTRSTCCLLPAVREYRSLRMGEVTGTVLRRQPVGSTGP